jgi:hypothetical protein
MKTALFTCTPVAIALVACGQLAGIGDRPGAEEATDGGIDASADASADTHVPSDAPIADGRAEGDAFDTCADAEDFYVGIPNACTYATITAAVAAARKSHAGARTVHVAPGIYRAASGEVFPIDLRGGISIDGTGTAPQDTIIEGTGARSHVIEGGSVTDLHATFLVGDRFIPSFVRNLLIIPAEAFSSSLYGVFCDSGNSDPAAAIPPEPNFLLDKVIFNRGFFAELAVKDSTYPKSACNARVTSSMFKGEYGPGNWTYIGVDVGGCSGPDSAWPSVEVGDGKPEHGNTFYTIGDELSSFGAVNVTACTGRVSIRGNRFFNGTSGVMLEDFGKTKDIVITGNTFDSQAFAGVALRAAPTVNELSGNTFKGCDGAGVLVQNGTGGIVKARKNLFVGNNHGVRFDNTWRGGPYTGVYDFGTADSHGENEFRCNGHTSSVGGYDVGLNAPVEASAKISFVGNRWDHVPPTTAARAANGSYPDGIDLLLPPSGPAPATDIPGQATSDCPAGRGAGP